MKIVLIAVAAAGLLFAAGCSQHNVTPRNFRNSHVGVVDGVPAGGPANVGQVPHSYFDNTQAPLGPPSPTYAYPYYTTRAPRDFLRDNPPPIGL